MINYNKIGILCPVCKCQFAIDKKRFLEKDTVICPSCDTKISSESLSKLQETLKSIDEINNTFSGGNRFDISLIFEREDQK